ncbi:class I SAM-dependent methyltransferase [Flavobacterium salilacus subsp. salilacus]|uniref:class I SAM-dependent methyltransferase n=1 Tax=Flavobacterium TaxID=237 RepID=UPI001074FB1E|nr:MULTISPECIES: class I SAM-dependent methyltransferase [Flavobacterium]KAF2518186.1 class I SAM-dependent methyltransferase [Flavobacterium salilacus subsp. salilacus]MBE1615501.1 class I SAM-dependent methyltransferase [Flavobacterium sp. SaA2.13]
MNNKQHWETVYKTKQPNEVSWTQDVPHTSLRFIENFTVSKDANIIDIGGGDSNLVDHLLDLGYSNITVLDISEKALERAKERLGDKAKNVTWIACDITKYKPEVNYAVWHDRATFHFLTSQEQTDAYRDIVNNCVKGYMIIGTFSDKGPKKCSGLDITQYTEVSLETLFTDNFEKLSCLEQEHITPFGTTQNFLFCSFRKK